MPTRLFHILCPARVERVRIVDGEGPRAYPKMVLYNPPEGHIWPERYLFRPERGDVLEINNTFEAQGELYHRVIYIGEDGAGIGLYVCPGLRALSTIEVTAETANDQVLEVMRLRMRDWLDERNEWAQANGIESEYSITSMAADVAPWLDLGQAVALCERAGWPNRDTLAVPDGCEWTPGADRPAWSVDEHTRTVRAAVLLGANGEWRLCESCAALPRFKRFRVRRAIVHAIERDGGE
jgi:hypothetical protein